MLEYKSFQLNEEQKKDIETYLSFLCKLVVHNLSIAEEPIRFTAIALVGITLRRQVRLIKENEAN
jgi:hypothetical protein